MKRQLSEVDSSHSNKKAFPLAPFLCHNSTIRNLNELRDPAPAGRLAEFFDLLHKLGALHDLAEHDMLTVEPVGLYSSDEELRAVGVGASIGHGEQEGPVVLQLEILI